MSKNFATFDFRRHFVIYIIVYVYIYTCIYTYMHIHIYTYICIHVHECICMYIYIYIRTYIYEYTHNIHMYRLATHSTCVFTTSIQTGLLNSVSESILMFPAWNCRELLAEHVSVLRSANYIS